MPALYRTVMIGLAGLALAAPTTAQKADNQILPRSTQLQKQGEALLAAGKFEEAEDALETALAVDPRNRWAFIDIARVADRQHLYGKAIRMTNNALELEPNDPDAIAVQGEAMVQLGATARAKENLQKLQQICRQGCPQVTELSAAINRGSTVAAAKPADTPKTN